MLIQEHVTLTTSVAPPAFDTIRFMIQRLKMLSSV